MKKPPQAPVATPADGVLPPLPMPRRRKHAAGHALLFAHKPKAKHVWLVAGALALVLAAVTAVFFFTDFQISDVTGAITRSIEKWPAAALLPLMAVLPVAGFPISVVYLIAGARFGPLWGGVVVAGVTAFHLLATHAVARSFLRGPIERFVHRKHKKLPEIPLDEQPAIAVIVGLVPGVPYFVRNYLLALSGVRLRTYFWICLPIYVARSFVTILLGDLSSDPNRRALMILVAVDVVKVVICGGVIWWLRRHHRKYHGHEHDEPAAGGSLPPTAAAS